MRSTIGLLLLLLIPVVKSAETTTSFFSGKISQLNSTDFLSEINTTLIYDLTDSSGNVVTDSSGNPIIVLATSNPLDEDGSTNSEDKNTKAGETAAAGAGNTASTAAGGTAASGSGTTTPSTNSGSNTSAGSSGSGSVTTGTGSGTSTNTSSGTGGTGSSGGSSSTNDTSGSGSDATAATVTVIEKVTDESGNTVTDSDGNPVTEIIVEEVNNTVAATTVSVTVVTTAPNSTAAARCETSTLSGGSMTITKILFFLSCFWIWICCLITIVVNIRHKNKGHHRWIHLYQEIWIMILYLMMGILNLSLRNHESPCKAISILTHISIIVITAALLFEAIFANSMVHNKAMMNGTIPPIVNYIVPIILGLVVALITYFTRKNSYFTGLHCFCTVTYNSFWGFVIPVWLLLFFAGLKSSLGNLACDMTDLDIQDSAQVFWCKKSCKALFFFGFNLLTCYMLCLFASSQQKAWIAALFFLATIVFGPVIFICHTFCHHASSVRFYGSGGGFIKKFYTPCVYKALPVVPAALVAPPDAEPEPVPEKEPIEEPKEEPVPEEVPKAATPLQGAQVQPAPEAPRAATPPEPVNDSPRSIASEPDKLDTSDTHAQATEFYNWAQSSNKRQTANEILFRPSPVN